MLTFLLTLIDESNHDKIVHLYESYHDYMMRYAVSKFTAAGRRNQMFDAEDAVQNAFVKITKYIHNIDFSASEKEIKNYVFTILSNEIYNILKENKEFDEINEESVTQNEYDFIEELNVKERYNEVVKAIEGMDEKYSTTLFLTYCKEMTVNEIAKLMGISVKTVYTRLTRGRKLLLGRFRGVNI